MSLEQKKYSSCILILQGSAFDLGVACGSLVISSGVFLGGVIVMIDSHRDRVLAMQPIIFLVGQSFTVTSLWRDRDMFHEYDIARPTVANVVQSVFFFVISFFFVFHVLFNLVDHTEWRAFYVMTTSWVLASALNLAKFMRDKNYAAIFEEVHEEDLRLFFYRIANICKGSIEYRIFVWCISLAALLLLFVVIWAWDSFELPLRNKAFITISLIWWWVGTIHIAQLLNNRMDSVMALQLQQHLPFQIMVGLSCMLSYVMLVWMLAGLDLRNIQRFYILTAWGFSAFGLCLLGKHITDRINSMHLYDTADWSAYDDARQSQSSDRGSAIQGITESPPVGMQGTSPPVDRRQLGRCVQEIQDFAAPAQHRGAAAELMGQRSLGYHAGNNNPVAIGMLGQHHAEGGYSERLRLPTE